MNVILPGVDERGLTLTLNRMGEEDLLYTMKITMGRRAGKLESLRMRDRVLFRGNCD